MASKIPQLRLRHSRVKEQYEEAEVGAGTPLLGGGGDTKTSFMEGVKKKLPRLGRSKSIQNLSASGHDLITPRSPPRSARARAPSTESKSPHRVRRRRSKSDKQLKKKKKKEKEGNEIREKKSPGIVVTSAPMRGGLSKWEEMLMAEKGVSADDMLLLAMKTQKNEPVDWVKEEDDDEDDEHGAGRESSDSDGGYVSPSRYMISPRAPHDGAEAGAQSTRVRAQLKALSDLMTAQPQVFER